MKTKLAELVTWMGNRRMVCGKGLLCEIDLRETYLKACALLAEEQAQKPTINTCEGPGKICMYCGLENCNIRKYEGIKPMGPAGLVEELKEYASKLTMHDAIAIDIRTILAHYEQESTVDKGLINAILSECKAEGIPITGDEYIAGKNAEREDIETIIYRYIPQPVLCRYLYAGKKENDNGKV